MKSCYKKVFLVVGMILFLLILININFLVYKFADLRFDFTKEHLFTLSQGTKNIIHSIHQPVTIRFYRSYSGNRMPIQLRNYERTIEDLLYEYKSISNGKILLEIYDPTPDSSAEASAQLDDIQDNKLANGENCYLGIAINCNDKTVTIPFLSPQNQNLIEYDITRGIYDVSHPEKPKIGILSPINVIGNMDASASYKFAKFPAWIFIQELQRNFDVKELPYNTKSIPENEYNTIIVLHPANMSIDTQIALDQYLLNGGKLIIFVDPYSVAGAYYLNQGLTNSQIPPDASDLPKLFHSWGVSFSEANQVVISPEDALKPQMQDNTKEYPAVLELKKHNMDENDVIMNGINKLDFIFSGGFSFLHNKDKKLTYTTLVKTSSYANYCEGFSYYMKPEELMVNFKPLNKPIILVLKISGSFKSAFSEQRMEEWSQNRKMLTKSLVPSSVLLVGDADMLFNPFCVSFQDASKKGVKQINDNIEFILNAVDQFSGDFNIMQIRTKSSVNRTFTRLEEIYNSSAKLYQEKILALQKELTEVDDAIKSIHDKEMDSSASITAQELEKLNLLRRNSKKINNELIDIKRNLRIKVEHIKNYLIFYNIVLIPSIIIIIGLIIAMIRKFKCHRGKI